MLIRYYDGYVVKGELTDTDIGEIKRDFEAIDDAGAAQIKCWLEEENDKIGELVVLRFSDGEVRSLVNQNRFLNNEEYVIPLSAALRRFLPAKWEVEWATKKRRRAVEEYQGLSREEWVGYKNSLQRLIAAGEGHRLNPTKPEFAGYEAMFGVMAIGVWNAARGNHGQSLSIPSAEEISTACEKVIRRWEMRQMV